MDIEDIFKLGEISEDAPELTKSEWIAKARKFFEKLDKAYGECWEPDRRSDEDLPECSRCHGFLYIEQGGVGDVDCPSCCGTGRELPNKILNAELLGEKTDGIIMNCDMWQLLESNTEPETDWIENTKENVPKQNGLVLVNCQKKGENCTIDDMFIAFYKNGRGFEIWGAGREPNNDFPVTHWKHLPTPPTK